jgi:hypothetical protein
MRTIVVHPTYSARVKRHNGINRLHHPRMRCGTSVQRYAGFRAGTADVGRFVMLNNVIKAVFSKPIDGASKYSPHYALDHVHMLHSNPRYHCLSQGIPPLASTCGASTFCGMTFGSVLEGFLWLIGAFSRGRMEFARTIICGAVLLAVSVVPRIAFSASDANKEDSVELYSLDPDSGGIKFEGTVPRSELPERVSGTPVPWRIGQSPTDKRCGIKALFVFLRLKGATVELAELEKQVTVGENGVDMLKLKEVASQYGVESEVVECSAEDLARLLPAIVLLQEGTGSARAHYNVVTSIKDDQVYYVEPSAARYEQQKFGAFSRSFARKALVASSELNSVTRSQWSGVINYALGIFIIGEVAFIWSLRMKRA